MSSITKLQSGTSVVRETALNTRTKKPILVELYPGYLVLRVKGSRSRYSIHYDSLLERLMWDEAHLKSNQKTAIRAGW